jgi:peptidoglycan/xylan/chitin deacetylase (PgdA/CDA1 family)
VIEVRRQRSQVAKIVLDRLLTAIGVLIYRAGLFRWVIHLNRRSPKVLMYHACDDVENEFIRGLCINTTPSQFAAHLDYLTGYYRVVPLADLIEQPPPIGAVALTFDDGFRSVYENAWPQLQARGLPATCFLATSAIGNEAPLWINELNWFLRSRSQMARPIISKWLGLKPSCSQARILRFAVDNYAAKKVDELLRNLRARTGIDQRFLARRNRLHLEWDQVAEMSAAGMSFGNHTCSHIPLALVTLDACREEIRGAFRPLEHLGGARKTLAYPFGSHSEETRRVALELGVCSLLDVEGVNSPLDPTRIGRIKVRSDSVPILFARMEVVEPVKCRLKRWMRRWSSPATNGI